MKHFRKLSCLLVIGGVIACLGVLAAPAPAQAQCTAKATLPADINGGQFPATGFDTGAHVIASFNTARLQESPPCTVSLSIDPAAYDAATPQQQVLLLINAERADRGISIVQLDATLLSQISYNHAEEMIRYNYISHLSPINAPNQEPTNRIVVNPAITDHKYLCCEENIAWYYSPGAAVYDFMYIDSDSNWGHRQDILGYVPEVGTGFGLWDWVGIGVGQGASPAPFYVLDFFQDGSLSTPKNPYIPPTVADTQPPSIGQVSVEMAFGTQVSAFATGVKDNSDGSTTGVAGVTGVVFYFGSIGPETGPFTTISASNQGNGTWTAVVPNGADISKLHAVAVDGSGNFTDCALGVGAAKVADFGLPTANSNPYGITSGPDGNLWFTEYLGNKIGRITPAGVITGEYNLSANSNPSDITSGPDGNLWFTETGTGKIGRITTVGIINEYDIPTANSGPRGITSGPDGNFWFTETATSKIGRITPAGAVIGEYNLSANSAPWGITSGPDGNLWFTEFNGIKIGRITPTGAVDVFPVRANPVLITSGPDGNLWFTAYTLIGGFAEIGRITPTGTITEDPVPSTNIPFDITSGPDGNLWFTAYSGNIGRFAPGAPTVISEYPAGGLRGITRGPDCNVWFTNAVGNKIGRITTH